MDLRDYLILLRKRWWIIALVAVIAAGSAYAFSKVQTPIYSSSIKLNNESSRPDWGQTQTIKLVLRQYVSKLSTHILAQRVVNELQLDISADKLLSKVAFNPDESYLTIEIEVRDPNGTVAQRIVQKYAELFVLQRQTENLEIDQRDRIITSIADNPTDPELFSPKTSINVLAGGVLGGLLGVVVVFGIEWLESDIVRSSDDVERYLGVPVIGTIPTITARDAKTSATPHPRFAFWRRAS
jgi:protein tyrosine kinase modulator